VFVSWSILVLLLDIEQELLNCAACVVMASKLLVQQIRKPKQI
jgi:hypothetical protein